LVTSIYLDALRLERRWKMPIDTRTEVVQIPWVS
jgi:hypothetical protein